MTYAHYKRTWLNEKHGRAFVISNIEEHKEWGKDKRTGPINGWCSFDIGDCSNTVTLDFSYDQKDKAKVKRKMARFREAFAKFEAAVLKSMTKGEKS